MGIVTVLRISGALLASPFGPVPHAPAVPQAIRAQYGVMTAAIQKSNLNAFDACFAPGYITKDLTGKTSKRAAYLAGIHGLVSGAKKTALKLQLKGAYAHNLKGAPAQNDLIDVSFEYTGNITKAAGVTTFHEVGEDTWKKFGKTWLLIKTVDSVMEVKAPASKKK